MKVQFVLLCDRCGSVNNYSMDWDHKPLEIPRLQNVVHASIVQHVLFSFDKILILNKIISEKKSKKLIDTILFFAF